MPASRRTSRRKDRLIQTRVPSDLESTLKEEARKRRLSVSHLIRNILEDAFQLVDGVVVEVDNLVTDSVGLAEQLKREAQRLAAGARGLTKASRAASDTRGAPEPARPRRRTRAGSRAASRAPARGAGGGSAPLDVVSAWNPVVLNRSARCSRCGAELSRGGRAFVGLSDDPGAPRVWLCPDCAERL